MSKYFNDNCKPFSHDCDTFNPFVVPEIDSRVISTAEKIEIILSIIKDLEDRVEELEKKA